jgi:hypothetical protein
MLPWWAILVIISTIVILIILYRVDTKLRNRILQRECGNDVWTRAEEMRQKQALENAYLRLRGMDE